VLKAGFLSSGRYGNGISVVRLANGAWSAPSAIGLGGARFGGQIGFKLTDFVFVLNDAAAVRAFSQQGSLTLGGSVSLAAGPIRTNAEAASLKGVASVFSYSQVSRWRALLSSNGEMRMRSYIGNGSQQQNYSHAVSDLHQLQVRL
jgi:SH3 domain-containing YSC84-like protein 1